MAVRTTMSTLINRVRTLISDPTGSPQFQDQDIQDIFDSSWRTDVIQAPLCPVATRQVGGVVQWLDYYAGPPGGAVITDWEDLPVLYDFHYATIIPNAYENLTGHWSFLASVSANNTGQIPNVFISGRTFDVYGASADLLEAWAAKVKMEFDFGMGRGDSFSLSQKSKAMMDLAKIYRGRQRAGVLRVIPSGDYESAPAGMAAWDWAPF